VTAWLPTSLRGVCMGVADIIPGVSGGTLALILGIYQRFVGAVSAIGPGMLAALLKGSFWGRLRAGLSAPDSLGESEEDRYAAHVLFLAFLGAGIGAAVLVGARVLPTLLNLYPAPMKGFFFGLVLASIVIPYRQMKTRGPSHLLSFALALLATWMLMGLPLAQSGRARGEVVVSLGSAQSEAVTLSATSTIFMTALHGGENAKREVAFGPAADVVIAAGALQVTVPVISRMAGQVANVEAGALTILHGAPDGASFTQAGAMTGGEDPALWFVFLAGVVAISAMVLPGISGSFILLMLGLYHFMTFTLRSLVYDQDMGALTVTAVFVCALVIGITGFSRVLRMLLERYHDLTMAALVGLMIGSLKKIWPFVATSMDGGVQTNVLPATMDDQVLMTLVTFALGVVAVVGLERAGRKALQGEQGALP
jgi:uncharacterized membrane protein